MKEPAANFDAIARPYRWMEYLSFGRALERCRFHFLPALAGGRTALVLGDGDGRFLARLLAANPALHADAVDISPAMLELLTRRASVAVPDAADRLRTHRVNALDFAPYRSGSTPEGGYDLIVTHFFLDCLTQREVETLAQRVIRLTAPNALWLVSEFRIPAGLMHWPSRAIVRMLYASFRLLTGLRTSWLPDHNSALRAAGFSQTALHLSLGGLLTSEVWEYTPSMLPPQKPRIADVQDPVPDPEPASPSLAEPDPGVFHHDTGGLEPDQNTQPDQ
jgi:SAM-dependent methyltransferase